MTLARANFFLPYLPWPPHLRSTEPAHKNFRPSRARVPARKKENAIVGRAERRYLFRGARERCAAEARALVNYEERLPELFKHRFELLRQAGFAPARGPLRTEGERAHLAAQVPK